MAELSAAILDRLRINLKTAGIAVSDATIQGMIEKGFLGVPTQFEALTHEFPLDLVPDYLGNWGAGLTPSATSQQRSDDEKTAAPTNSIMAIASQLKTRAVSPVALTEQALARIAERDPVLNAFQLVLTDRALAAAQHAEAEIKQSNYRGPLHGVPVAIKDLLDLAGTPTTAGSKILAEQVRQENATVVDRLENAGAIIVGKTRMSEFAYAPGSVNGHYGPTRNPRNLAYDTGGSSSGSGAAVADELVYAALGTDTGCSIRMPAAFCGLVGLKPTFGRVSLAGGVTLSWSLDHCGPLTRSVTDAALLLSVLAGPDARDLRTRLGSEFSFAAFTQSEPSIRGLRIGVLRNDGTSNPLATPEVLAGWRTGLAQLEKQGAELIEIDLPDMQAMRIVGGALIANEALAYHQANLRTRFKDFGEFLQQRILAVYAYDTGAYVRAQQMRGVLRQRANAIFEQIDLLSTPSIPAVAPTLGAVGSTALSIPFNLLGWPAITVPSGQTAEGLPIGLQLVGKPWDELTVLRAARALETAG
ncbi:MAG: amidase [Chloroflexi bacterium]|nr:amidase [Chloroflexota bacterium]